MAITPRTARDRGSYDRVAESYDSHFVRPVDRWEDERLASLLAPLVEGRRILDLGCGTGWVLDHLSPGAYIGVDRSQVMLDTLRRKHPEAVTFRVEVGEPGWAGEMPQLVGFVDVVVSTWAAEYFVDLAALLFDLRARVLGFAPGWIALHGCQPRGSRRGHFIDPGLAHRGAGFLPRKVAAASEQAGLHRPLSVGVGATPDRLAGARWRWDLGLYLPARWHYSALHVWRAN